MIVFHFLNIVVYHSRQRIDWRGITREQNSEIIDIPRFTSPAAPDIYYIIVDRYANDSTLKTVYRFDNREFLDFLAQKKFYVASQSRANYLTTLQSLASSLNFQYINYLAKHADPDSSYRIPINHLLEDFRLRRVLKNRSYRHFHLGSWWEPTRTNRLADQNIRFKALPEMFYVLYGRTMAYPLTSRLGILDLRRDNWKNTQRQFQQLSEISRLDGPKFVFAHFVLPHPPYVFDRDGNFLEAEEAATRGNEKNYVKQLIFTNHMLKTVINHLLSDPKRQPVIVLQSDEGPWPSSYEKNSSTFQWEQATDAELRQKMGILNSYYFPGVETNGLYDSISPVNSFRLVLNLYFGASLSLLPDESFVFPDYRRPYVFRNITAKLKD